MCIASSLHILQERRRKDKLLLLHTNQLRNTWSSLWFLPQTYPDPDISSVTAVLDWQHFQWISLLHRFLTVSPLRSYIYRLSSVSSNCFHVSSSITRNGYKYDTAELSEDCNFHRMVVQSYDGTTKK